MDIYHLLAKHQNFLKQCIESIGKLEVLLLLYQNTGREWNADMVSTELRTHRGAAQMQLDQLTKDHLLKVDSRNPQHYRYDPATTELRTAVSDIATVYKTHPTRVIEWLYAPQKGIEDFANAFVIKKEKPHG